MWDIIPVLDEIKSLCISNKKIGIFCSGGFDSTVLLYTMVKTISDNRIDCDLVVYTVPRYDDSARHVDRITKWVFGVIPLQYSIKHVGDPDLHHSQQVRSGVIQSLKHDRDVLILGDTMIPEHLLEGSPTRVRSPIDNIVQPFFEYDKRLTLQIAQHYGILDNVAELSHTCTDSKDLRCGKCWQDGERAWAFNSLGLVDVGTM